MLSPALSYEVFRSLHTLSALKLLKENGENERNWRNPGQCHCFCISVNLVANLHKYLTFKHNSPFSLDEFYVSLLLVQFLSPLCKI